MCGVNSRGAPAPLSIYMLVKRFIASQLRRPTGWFGSLVVSRVMNRVNGRLVNSTLKLLQVQPQHQVLEIGFGGGYALLRLSRILTTGAASGVDVSPDMVRQAERKYRRGISDGHLRVQVGDILSLPFGADIFDRAFTVNTIYFWPDTLQGFREIRRVLKRGGMAAVSLRSKEKMQPYAVTKYDFRLFDPEEAADLMRQAGFRNVWFEHRDRDRAYDEVIVLGTKGD